MITGLDHIAIAVPDLEKAIARFAEDFGLTFKGKEDVEDAKTSTAFFPTEKPSIELIHPLRGEGPVQKYLEKKGIPHVMDSCALSDYKAKLATTDIIVSSKHLSGEMDAGEGKFVLGVQNMLNPNSFGDELLDIINKNFIPTK